MVAGISPRKAFAPGGHPGTHAARGVPFVHSYATALTHVTRRDEPPTSDGARRGYQSEPRAEAVATRTVSDEGGK